jgi:eukaryotic-like serine/threonine-protein kinase
MITIKPMVHASSPDQAGREGMRSEPAPSGVEGRVLGGRYRLLRQLGTGGMGSVWLCEHVALGRRFALKVLNADRAADPELVERFRQEARAASCITQENVVDVIDSGEDAGDHYYVMEALDGRSLAQVLREESPLPVARALGLLEQVCRALAAAHGRGVIHCDVKPDNVLVERLANGGERAKLIDFGISRLPGAGRLTRDGEVIGTPEYMSPEQAAGDEVDARTDVYATGVLAFELITGRLPLIGPNAIATLVAHQTKTPAPPGQHRPGLGPEVDRLVLRALSKRPADRFPSMQAMAAEVTRVRLHHELTIAGLMEEERFGPVETLSLPATPAPTDTWGAAAPQPPEAPGLAPRPPQQARREARRRGLTLGLLGASLILAAVAMVVALWSGRPPAPVQAPQPVSTAPRPVTDEPPQPVAPRRIDEEPANRDRAARPPRPRPPAEPPAHDPYAPAEALKGDPFR